MPEALILLSVIYIILKCTLSPNRFSTDKQLNGITIIKDKETSDKFIQYKNGNVTKIN